MTNFVSDHLMEIITAVVTAVICVIGYAYTVGKRMSRLDTDHEQLREDMKEVQSHKSNETRAIVDQHHIRMTTLENRMELNDRKYETRFQRFEDKLETIHSDLGMVVNWVKEKKEHDE